MLSNPRTARGRRLPHQKQTKMEVTQSDMGASISFFRKADFSCEPFKCDHPRLPHTCKPAAARAARCEPCTQKTRRFFTPFPDKPSRHYFTSPTHCAPAPLPRRLHLTPQLGARPALSPLPLTGARHKATRSAQGHEAPTYETSTLQHALEICHLRVSLIENPFASEVDHVRKCSPRQTRVLHRSTRVRVAAIE